MSLCSSGLDVFIWLSGCTIWVDQYKQFPHPLRCPVLRAAWPRHTHKGCLCLQRGTGIHLCLLYCVHARLCLCVCKHTCMQMYVCVRCVWVWVKERNRERWDWPGCLPLPQEQVWPFSGLIFTACSTCLLNTEKSVILWAIKQLIDKVILSGKAWTFMRLSC